MERPIIIQGPPLPPKVNGDLLGTLTIRLQACSIIDGAFARIQFWGSSAYSDLHLQSNSSNMSAVEYPLIGSIPSLDNYMKDASPLRVSFLRPSNNNNELIGYAHISDMSITDKLKPESTTTQDQDGNTTATIRTIKLLLHREVQIVSSNNTAVSSGSVEKAVFELLFRVIVPPRPQPQQVQRDKQQVKVCPRQMVDNRPMQRQENTHNVQSSSTVPLNNLPQHNTNPSYFVQGQSNNSSVNKDSSIGQYSGNMYGGSSIEEKQSLLEELLDLCTDDMTIPTVNSDPSCIDPYDMWISRMVQHASSPPPKAFPSLLSAGSDQSHALRKVGLLKLEINSLSLSSSVTDKLKGKNDFYIQYNPPLYGQANTLSPSLDQQVEFVVCEQFSSGNQSNKVMTNNRKTASPKVAKKKLTNISLLSDIHTNEMKVMPFQDDEYVRQWLDGTTTFDLFCRPSSTAGHTPKLPRVAMLSAAKRKERKLGKICIAQATLKLCDLLLSNTLTTDVKLDLLLSEEDDELLSDVGKASSTKVGSMSIRLGLYPGNNKTTKASTSPPSNQPLEASDRAAYHERSTPIMVNGFQPYSAMSSTTPHPISVFLSNFARGGTVNDNVTTNMSSSTANGRQASSQEAHEKASSGLKPVKAPPVWLDVRVERLSKSLALDNIASIEIGISCNEPILSSSEPINIQKTVDVSETNGICSWQIALESERKQDCATIVTLHIYRVEKSGDASSKEKTLFGLVKIPFIVTMPKQSWLPAIVNNSWLDILDPTSHTTNGKVQVLIVAGMLRQVRGFSSVCKSTLTIQKWWKKLKSASKEVAKPKVVPESLNISEIKATSATDTPLPKDEEDVVDTIHEGFNVAQHKRRQKDDDDPTSSPDSLFEEWSQQSQSLSMNMHKLPTSVVHETSIGEEDVTLDSAIGNDEAVPSVEAVSLKAESSNCHDKDDISSLKPPVMPVHHQSGGVPRVNINPPMSTEQTGTTQEDPIMSTIKPMNLEVSFSCGQDEMSRRPKGIDPPEEITPKPPPALTRVPKAPSNAKRKLDTPSSDVENEETTRVYKRYRLKESAQQFNPPLQPLHESMNEDAANENAQQDNGDESETLCPSSSDASFDCDDDEDSDAEDVLTYRSLSSMIGSLDDINSRLTQRVVAEPLPERSDSSSPSDERGVGVDTAPPPTHHAAPPPQQEPQVFERLDSPERPKIEPPEEKSSTPAPKRSNDKKIVKTCEKGISTTKLLYTDATTSPSGDSLMNNTNIRVDDDRRHHQKSSDIATEPEVHEQDENDNCTTQAEISKKRVHTSLSAAYQPRRGQYTNHHLTRGRGSSATKRYSSLLSSHLRGSLSPVFRQRHLSRSPLREILQKEKRDNNIDTKENKSLSKERLEQIFKSTK